MDHQKTVVIVAPQFPPSNLTAGHRSRYFASHLPKFGWKVKVLSVNPIYYEEKLDRELEALLPPDLEVIRTKAFPVKPIRLIGDVGIRAFWWHYKVLCNLVQKEKVDLIYIPIPPNYSSLLGPLIYRRFGIPYAVDYIDPWVHPWPGCKIPLSKAWCSYQLARVLEPVVLRHVSLITAVAPGYYEGALKRFSWLDASRCVAIPYGADENDFRHGNKNGSTSSYLFNPSDGNLHIVYAGAMLPKAYSTLEELFQAISLIKKDNPLLAQKMRFHFIGTGSRVSDSESFTVKPWVQRHNLSDSVFEYPARIPYLDVLRHLKIASAVLILGSSEPHYTPSKVFQAILSKRPVIGLLHSKSTAIKVLKDANAGAVVAIDEYASEQSRVINISRAIQKVLGNSFIEINWPAFSAYTVEKMTQKLALAFETALDAKGQTSFHRPSLVRKEESYD